MEVMTRESMRDALEEFRERGDLRWGVPDGETIDVVDGKLTVVLPDVDSTRF